MICGYKEIDELEHWAWLSNLISVLKRSMVCIIELDSPDILFLVQMRITL